MSFPSSYSAAGFGLLGFLFPALSLRRLSSERVVFSESFGHHGFTLKAANHRSSPKPAAIFYR